MNDTLKAINFFEIKNISQMPQILLHGEYLFHSDFLPDQLLKAEVYQGKIVITPAIPNKNL